MPSTDRMSPRELRASLGLAGVSGLRMLGLFIILPVFALYARDLPGGNNQTLVGLALGAYGLAQAMLQIAFGKLSDRWGRKRTIYLGLLIFAAGSFVAAFAQDIYMVALGRAIQGAGAISAAVIALVADLTSSENRTKAMAIIGMSIGATFAVSMVAGPALGHTIGVPGIFAMTGVLAMAALPVVRFVVPDPAEEKVRPASAVPLSEVLRDSQLMRLNVGILFLHAILMALFVVLPVLLVEHLPAGKHWQIYLPVMVAGVAIMVPVLLVSERRGRQKAAFLGAIALLAVSSGAVAAAAYAFAWAIAGLVLFFAAFNLLEASLPSLISKLAPPAAKGAAIGVYSTLQFLGTFLGASIAGWLAQHVGRSAVFGFCASLAVIWFVVASGMKLRQSLATRRYPLPKMGPERASGIERELARLPGVREVRLSPEGVAYLKVDSTGFDEQNVIRLLANET
jgi:MFS family permease